MTRKHIVLLLILILTAILRFYNLMWGNGYFFHPDEGNMARSVAQMTWAERLYPDFFAYGQLPLYFAYCVAIVVKSIWSLATLHSFPDMPAVRMFTDPGVPAVSFPEAVFWLRFLSAVSSTATVWLVYKATVFLISAGEKDNLTIALVIGTLSAVFTAFTPGLIQAGHFGTTESILGACFMAVVYLSFKIVRFRREKRERALRHTITVCGIVLGIALGSKITAVYFLLAPFLALFLPSKLEKLTWKKKAVSLAVSTLYTAVLATVAVTVFAIMSPYHILAYQNFIGTSTYETEVATGDVQVFYTRQFIDTTPLLFQALRVAPYALGLPLYIVGSIGLMVCIFDALRKKTSSSSKRIPLIVVTASFLAFVVPNSFLFVKWTRFLTPAIPLFLVMGSYGIYRLRKSIKRADHMSPSRLWRIFLAGFMLVCIVPGIVFFTIYIRPDSRMQASLWIYQNIPDGAYVLSETANVVDIPFPVVYGDDAARVSAERVTGLTTHDITPYAPARYQTISFNFYELADVPGREHDLLDHLVRADYIYVPSRRIYANHMRFPDRFPTAHRYYQSLFSGDLGYQHRATITSRGIVESSILPQNKPIQPEDIFIHDEMAEESWTVFDHPVIRIFQKTEPRTREEYGTILGIL